MDALKATAKLGLAVTAVEMTNVRNLIPTQNLVATALKNGFMWDVAHDAVNVVDNNNIKASKYLNPQNRGYEIVDDVAFKSASFVALKESGALLKMMEYFESVSPLSEQLTDNFVIGGAVGATVLARNFIDANYEDSPVQYLTHITKALRE